MARTMKARTTKTRPYDMSNRGKTIYLVQSVVYGGATHALRGRRLAKLLTELKFDRGGPEVLALIEAGYFRTLGGVDLSDEGLYQKLQDEADGKVLEG